MGCGVRPPQGLGIKAVVYEFLVRKIGESLFLQGDDNTYSTIIPLIKNVLNRNLKVESGHLFFRSFIILFRCVYILLILCLNMIN